MVWGMANASHWLRVRLLLRCSLQLIAESISVGRQGLELLSQGLHQIDHKRRRRR